ncbi:CDP-diacylglycerol--glycerol-3-phosphate 3-phosphatidyltransferase [Spiroplasma endosymbiont of Nephrotoma flavescens]|uniref:CDP-diacylglycerol--glycerol-3-phosphate 3-phosphatidyltransferase n=1 Tax=Spiroplasma endosymbiont of Nephrotoma flavescens TaxID=3066302 RepID=UPI00313E5ACA
MNLPNKITLVRIILVPIILILMLLGGPFDNYNFVSGSINIDSNVKINILWIIAGFLFIIACFSDWLDGYLARKNNQVTNFGKIADPIADKMLTSGVLIIMTIPQIIPVWVTLILISRDILLDGIRMFLATKKVVIAANYYGKLKTLMQMVGLTLLFFINHIWFGWDSGWGSWKYHIILIPMYLSLLLSIWSAITYILGIKQSNQK